MLSTLRGISLTEINQSLVGSLQRVLFTALGEEIKLFTEVKLAKPQWKNTRLYAGILLIQESERMNRQ